MNARRAAAPAAVRWTAYVGVAIVFAIACAFLSNWQLSKNIARDAQLQLISQNYNAAPVTLSAVLAPGATLKTDEQWRPVRMTGTYLADDQVLAANRVQGGSAAYELLVPFRLTDGRVFLVDRGWEPPGNRHPLPDDLPAPPRGQVTVVVRMMPGEPLPSNGRTAPRGQVPSIHLPAVAAAIGGSAGAALERGAYGQIVSEDPAPATSPNGFTSPSADPGPYLSYGIQWILFAVMGFIFIWYVIRTERRVHREEAEEAAELAALAAVDPEAAERRLAEVDATHRRIRPAAGRTDRDADVEDEMADRLLR